MKCYCCSGKSFAECCEPFLLEHQLPQVPEQLMRSRYSAFCCNNPDYLVKTHWPIEPASIVQIKDTINTTKWLGLKIVDTLIAEDKIKGVVEFVAFFEDNGVQQLHERSNFSKIDERWYYTQGSHLPPIKLGRNDPCFCGSGKKLKKCHPI